MSTQFRIGMVSPDAPPHIGGMGRHVGALTDGLRALGIHVSLFDRTRRPILFGLGRNIGFSICLSSALRRFAASERLDILHLHAGPGGALLPFPPKGIPLLITANHTYYQQSHMPGQRWKRVFIPWERRMYHAADRIVCISEATKKILMDSYGVEDSRIVVQHCGFDLTPWVNADLPEAHRHARTCVFVGRPDGRKGWDILVSAWPQVLEVVPDALLHVVGFHHAPKVGMQFHGRLSDTELARLVGCSSLVVCPSRMEGFGLVAAEAIAAGTPVVATNAEGLREVVEDGCTGILVQPSSPDALAETLVGFFSDTQVFRRLHDGCRSRRARFASHAEIRAYCSAYDAVYSARCI